MCSALIGTASWQRSIGSVSWKKFPGSSKGKLVLYRRFFMEQQQHFELQADKLYILCSHHKRPGRYFIKTPPKSSYLQGDRVFQQLSREFKAVQGHDNSTIASKQERPEEQAQKNCLQVNGPVSWFCACACLVCKGETLCPVLGQPTGCRFPPVRTTESDPPKACQICKRADDTGVHRYQLLLPNAQHLCEMDCLTKGRTSTQGLPWSAPYPGTLRYDLVLGYIQAATNSESNFPGKRFSC